MWSTQEFRPAFPPRWSEHILLARNGFLPCLFMTNVPLLGLLMFSDEELGVGTVQHKGDENSGWGDGPYSQFRVHLR